MNLHDGVRAVTLATLPSMSDGSVVFSAPPAEFTDTDGDPATVTVDADVSAGGDTVVATVASGSLEVSAPVGSVVDVNGTDYVITRARTTSYNRTTLTFTPGLVADVFAGDPISASGSRSITVANSITTSNDSAAARPFADKVKFSFQYHLDLLPAPPAHGWPCTRTLSNGQILTGNVVDSDSGGIMVTVWCGGA